MKRITGILLVLVMLLSGIAWAEESGLDTNGTSGPFIPFDPTITEIADLTPEEWMFEGEIRGLLTLFLTIDLESHLEDSEEASPIGEIDVTQASYVGKDDLGLVVYLQAEKSDVIIGYFPWSGEAYYALNEEAPGELFAEALMEEMCSDGYYKNTLSDLMNAYDFLEELVS